ncbi:MAG TPA: ChaN family lipoprotein [Bacteroidales bacterium]|nr:ChaN family lipoprotein [Bacteroidales bacterium]
MKAKTYLILFLLLLVTTSMKKHNPAYTLFDQKGKEVTYQDLIKAASEAEIVLFGELHNNPISHWLQYELTCDLHELHGQQLILAAEMFEADNQLLLDEYISGTIRQRNFEDEAKLWNNYETDYKPLVEFARENKLTFVAGNIPRRYAAIVHQRGFEGLNELPDEAKKFIAPLPVAYDPELPGYKSMLEMMSGMGTGPASENLPKAQAVKDATMAYFILKNLKPGTVLIHYHGTYHSNNYEGIYWYLKNKNPDLKILTIASVEQEEIDSLTSENSALADFTICVPTTMTKTH